MSRAAITDLVITGLFVIVPAAFIIRWRLDERRDRRHPPSQRHPARKHPALSGDDMDALSYEEQAAFSRIAGAYDHHTADEPGGHQ